jgi:hypothetical protein
VKTFAYVKKKAATNELKHEEIESTDTCESVEVIPAFPELKWSFG